MIDIDPTRLHDQTDALNDAFEAFETEVLHKLGVKAFFTVEGAEPFVLSAQKRGGKFRLCVSAVGEDAAAATPLINTARETRIRAAHVMPTFHTALRAAFETEVARTAEALAVVDALLGKIGVV